MQLKPTLNAIKTIKTEVNEIFMRFPSYRFQVLGKIENLETSEMDIFSSQTTL